MEEGLFNNRVFRIVLSISIGLILFIAAVAKIINPGESLIYFYTLLGIGELVLAIGLVLFASRWQSWAVLSVVFAAWSGYSLYAAMFGLPCPCLGAGLNLPSGATLPVDAAVLGCSWTLLNKDSRFTPTICNRLLFLSLGAFFVGFLFPLVAFHFGT